QRIKQIGRPAVQSEETGFYIADPAATLAGEAEGFESDSKTQDQTWYPPHLLWLISAEGARINPEQFEKHQSAKKISTLLIGTEEEWKAIGSDLTLETKFGLEKGFKLVPLSAPSQEAKRKLVQRILSR